MDDAVADASVKVEGVMQVHHGLGKLPAAQRGPGDILGPGDNAPFPGGEIRGIRGPGPGPAVWQRASHGTTAVALTGGR